MKDIHDIKEILLGLPINISYSLIYLAIILIIILIFRQILKSLKNYFSKIDEFAKKETDFNDLLIRFKRNYFYSSKETFYSKLSEFIRLFLENKYSKNVSSMTFEEINSLDLNKEIKNILKSVYFKEYAKEIKDNDKIRTNLILEIEKLISKNK